MKRVNRLRKQPMLAGYLGNKGDLLTFMNFASLRKKAAKKWKPRVLVLGKGNKIADKRAI